MQKLSSIVLSKIPCAILYISYFQGGGKTCFAIFICGFLSSLFSFLYRVDEVVDFLWFDDSRYLCALKVWFSLYSTNVWTWFDLTWRFPSHMIFPIMNIQSNAGLQYTYKIQLTSRIKTQRRSQLSPHCQLSKQASSIQGAANYKSKSRPTPE